MTSYTSTNGGGGGGGHFYRENYGKIDIFKGNKDIFKKGKQIFLKGNIYFSKGKQIVFKRENRLVYPSYAHCIKDITFLQRK